MEKTILKLRDCNGYSRTQTFVKREDALAKLKRWVGKEVNSFENEECMERMDETRWGYITKYS